ASHAPFTKNFSVRTAVSVAIMFSLLPGRARPGSHCASAQDKRRPPPEIRRTRRNRTTSVTPERPARPGPLQPRRQRPHRARVDAPAILVASSAAVQVVDGQLTVAIDVIVGDHDAGDRPQQSGITDQPAENVRAERAEQLPRHHEDTNAAGDQPSRTEGDAPRIEVRKIVGWRYHVRRYVRV